MRKTYRLRRDACARSKQIEGSSVERIGDKKYVITIVKNGRKSFLQKDFTFDFDDESQQIEDFSTGSVLYQISEDGKKKTPKLWWKKGESGAELSKSLLNAVESVLLDTEAAVLPECKDTGDVDSLAVYLIADAHFGLLAHESETGANWDLKIAKEQFSKKFGELVQRTDSADECLIVSLGDFLHYDGVKPVTTASGNLLDVDSRRGKMYRTGFAVFRWAIELVSQKHKKVHVLLCQGNHDEASAQDFAHCLGLIYEGSERVEVSDNRNPFLYHRFGKNLLGFTHGTVKSKNELPMVMADDRYVDWGETTNRYWFTGHTHQRELFTLPGCVVETLPAICGRDYWTHSRGFRSKAEIHSVLFDRERGEITRRIVR